MAGTAGQTAGQNDSPARIEDRTAAEGSTSDDSDVGTADGMAADETVVGMACVSVVGTKDYAAAEGTRVRMEGWIWLNGVLVHIADGAAAAMVAANETVVGMACDVALARGEESVSEGTEIMQGRRGGARGGSIG